VFDWADRYGEGVKQIAQWMREGKFKSREDVVDGGIEAFPDALNLLFSGGNFGKLVLKVAED
jgi:NADPH-dependent curcumin reductase CurA